MQQFSSLVTTYTRACQNPKEADTLDDFLHQQLQLLESVELCTGLALLLQLLELLQVLPIFWVVTRESGGSGHEVGRQLAEGRARAPKE